MSLILVSFDTIMYIGSIYIFVARLRGLGFFLLECPVDHNMWHAVSIYFPLQYYLKELHVVYFFCPRQFGSFGIVKLFLWSVPSDDSILL
jgi:hypothetical protein